MPDDIQMPIYDNHGFGRKSEIKQTLSMAKWIYKRGHVYDNILPQEKGRQMPVIVHSDGCRSLLQFQRRRDISCWE